MNMSDTHFRIYTEQAFSFLVDRLGFSSSYGKREGKDDFRDSGEWVYFISKGLKLQISVIYARAVDEIYVEIDEFPPSYRFSLGLFVHAYHPEAGKELGFGNVGDDEELRIELKCKADVLQRYGQPLLRHDAAVFAHMKTVKYWELPPMVRLVRPTPAVEASPLFQSDQAFVLSNYVANGSLRLLGERSKSAGPAVEILVEDVRALELRTRFDGIRIEEADKAFLRQFPSKPENVLELGSRIYALRGRDWLGFVVGGTLTIGGALKMGSGRVSGLLGLR